MDDVYGTRTSTTEECVPDSNWTEDSMGHYLSVHLPGFKKEEVMVGLAYPGYVTISGERMASDDKCIYFSQPLRLPQSLDMNKISQNFQGEMLCLTFPKRLEEKDENANPTAEEKTQEKVSNDENQRKRDEEKSKQSDDHVVSVHKEKRKNGSILQSSIDLLKNNIILTVVSAFSLGVLVTRRFESDGD